MRTVTAIAALALFALPAAAAAPKEMSLGEASASVTIIEYGSVACPFCARFNATVMPVLKAKYIETGKARFVYRPMLTGVPAIAASGELLAECAGPANYFAVNDAIMRGQDEFYVQGENDSLARPVLLRIARDFGMDEGAFNRCVTNRKSLAGLQAVTDKALRSGINSTPTILVNGKQVPARLDAIEAAIANAKPPGLWARLKQMFHGY